MKRLVLKFGGTSVGSITKIKNVANIVNEKRKEGNEIIVVVSAMAGTTNNLVAHAEISTAEYVCTAWYSTRRPDDGLDDVCPGGRGRAAAREERRGARQLDPRHLQGP